MVPGVSVERPPEATVPAGGTDPRVMTVGGCAVLNLGLSVALVLDNPDVLVSPDNILDAVEALSNC